MDLKLDEQNLIAEFRHLHKERQQELLDYVAFLLKKQNNMNNEEQTTADNQCPLHKHAEERPEAKKEPIFTE